MNISTVGKISVPDRTENFNRAPLHAKPMGRISLGSIRPDGWIKHQLELMCNGTVGNLDRLSPFLDDDNGWLRYDKDYAGSKNEREKSGWEEVPYWIRGLYPLAVLTEDDNLLGKAERYIESILAGGDGDGYFGPRRNRNAARNGKPMPDLWPNMIVIDFLIHFYEVTGDARVIDLLTKFFSFCRDLPKDRFLAAVAWEHYNEEMDTTGNWQLDIQYRRAGDMIPHIYWLYNITGDEWLLDLSRRFFEKIAPYFPSRKFPGVLPDPPEDYLDTHVVHFTQRFGYYGVFGQQDDLEFRIEQSEYWYHHHLATWGQHPRGIFSADEMIRPGKTDPRQGFETCAMVEFAKHFYELGRISGNTAYADRVEDIMLNHFPVTHDPEMKGLHYLTASNMVQLDKEDGHDLLNDHKGMMLPYSGLTRYPTGYRCCQHNAGFGWPWYVQNMWQSTADEGLSLWLYGASHIKTTINESTIEISEKTDYPFSGDVKLRVRCDRPTNFPLYLRIPGWCTEIAVRVDGKELSSHQSGGFVKIDGEWHENLVEIELGMKISWTRWPRSGAATLDRGPLSYSVKIEERWVELITNPEWPSHEVFPASKWNYALSHPSIQKPRVTIKESIADQPWSIEAAPIEIVVEGTSLDSWGMVDRMIEPLPISPVETRGEVQEITLIPMGCARLRVSCFPIVEQPKSTKGV